MGPSTESRKVFIGGEEGKKSQHSTSNFVDMNIEDLAKDGEKGKPLKKKGYDDVEISDLSGGDSAKEGKKKGEKDKDKDK
ncbi:hypothetical protein COOONC_23468 [Cooperia oncophora]